MLISKWLIEANKPDAMGRSFTVEALTDMAERAQRRIDNGEEIPITMGFSRAPEDRRGKLVRLRMFGDWLKADIELDDATLAGNEADSPVKLEYVERPSLERVALFPNGKGK